MIKRCCMMLVGLVALLLPLESEAATAWTGSRYITSIGCHVWDNTCFVNISGGGFGPSACPSTSLRWRASDANGQNTFALLQQAYFSNKSVTFEVDISTCYVYQPGFPTFVAFVVGQ